MSGRGRDLLLPRQRAQIAAGGVILAQEPDACTSQHGAESGAGLVCQALGTHKEADFCPCQKCRDVAEPLSPSGRSGASASCHRWAKVQPREVKGLNPAPLPSQTESWEENAILKENEIPPVSTSKHKIQGTGVLCACVFPGPGHAGPSGNLSDPLRTFCSCSHCSVSLSQLFFLPVHPSSSRASKSLTRWPAPFLPGTYQGRVLSGDHFF